MLHGWGANYRDLVPVTSILELPYHQFIFANAPFAHPQVPGGRAWYSLETREYQGLTESRQLLQEWLLTLESSTGVPLSKTILSGFSQGGAMTLDVGLSLPLAGLCSMSGYLHSEPLIKDNLPPPVLITHGREDTVVPIAAARQTRDILIALGVTVDYQEFDGGHEVPLPVLALLQEFIQNNS